IILWIFLVFALRALPPRSRHLTDYLVAGLLTLGAWWALSTAYPTGLPLIIGGTLALGAVAHGWGGGLTVFGVPLLFPLVVRGQRWRSCGMRRPLRFRAGETVERMVVVPLSIAAAAATIVWVIGAWPWVIHRISMLFG